MKRKHGWWILIAAMTVGCSTAKFVRETSPEPFESNDAMVARGAYLVNNVASCGACHTGREDGEIISPESTELYLAGSYWVDEPGMKARFYMANITQDKETGIGSWTDDQIARAIRDGIRNDGTLLSPAMQYDAYQHMSDDDVKAVVAYLRTVPAVKSKDPIPDHKHRFEAGFFMRMAVNMGVTHHKPVHDVKGPEPGNAVAQGEYIATLGHCYACHSMGKMGPRKKDDRWYGGSDTAFIVPGVGTLYAPNLTPDEKTGLGKYSADQIKEALRTGHKLDGTGMAPPMALFIPHVSGLTEEDMDAVVAYLKSLEPVENQVPKRSLTKKWLDIVNQSSADVSDGGAKDEGADTEEPKGTDSGEESKKADDGSDAKGTDTK